MLVARSVGWGKPAGQSVDAENKGRAAGTERHHLRGKKGAELEEGMKSR